MPKDGPRSTHPGDSPKLEYVQSPVTHALSTPWLLVFDLDGTLIDSSEDLCNSVNAALQEAGLLALSQPEISSFIGDGAASLVQRAIAFRLGSGDPLSWTSLFDRCYAFFLAHYRVHKLDHTRPYPGVLECLQAIRQALPDVSMAVLTNKPVRPSREICDALGLSPFFFANYGGDSFATKKPAPEGLQAILQEALTRFRSADGSDGPYSPDRAVMIGDSPADIWAGRACGMRTVGCRYGLAPEALLASRPDFVVDAPGDLLAVFGLHR